MSHLPANRPIGVVFNVLGSALFALMYAYSALLDPLDGLQIYAWRIVLTIPCLAALLLATGKWHEVVRLARRLRRERFFWAQRLLSSALIGVQLWLFMWAPINGYGLDVSLGYFLLPITMVAVGRIAFGERLSALQAFACALAVLGIALQLANTGGVSWPALLVCLGYPAYFWLRRVTDTNNLASLLLDMAASLPLSLVFILQGPPVLAPEASTSLPWLILGLGLISASALGFQALSARHLTMTVFGLLIYVEPVLLVVASLLLGEAISAAQWPTYLSIWAAVIVLALEGVRSLRAQGRRR
ncbi:EamA family transporter RarD [Verticiella sediminum]|uniref:EamA family transporter RarD n=1 Tax=Verticiella sediminum TaxID=1247510 RepID=A0A556A9J3_9BURK|nr:EamA family transporter RarD [Verticiella sediminum]TSH89554.1 EamA family transporter RarD [Verticiella sediminum]